MKTYLFEKEAFKKLFDSLLNSGLSFEYSQKKHQISYTDSGENCIKIRLPLNINFDAKKNVIQEQEFLNYVLIMIRSGIGSVGFFENFVNERHKVFRAYMVRKKQGKSQIKHLKTKGKSRAGSRVRLQETLDFFDDINERLRAHFEEFRIDRIGISCSETLIPYLYGGKVGTPFEKQDSRIFKIPKHIQNPTYEALMETNEFLLKAEVKVSEQGRVILAGYFSSNDSEQIDEEEEDW